MSNGLHITNGLRAFLKTSWMKNTSLCMQVESSQQTSAISTVPGRQCSLCVVFMVCGAHDYCVQKGALSWRN